MRRGKVRDRGLEDGVMCSVWGVFIFSPWVGIHSETRWPHTASAGESSSARLCFTSVSPEKQDSNWFCCCRHFCKRKYFVAAPVLCMYAFTVCVLVCVRTVCVCVSWARTVDGDFDHCGCLYKTSASLSDWLAANVFLCNTISHSPPPCSQSATYTNRLKHTCHTTCGISQGMQRQTELRASQTQKLKNST